MTTGSADITVLIPVRNGANFVEEAVASLLEQDIDSVRVLLSDNQSTDATPAILERLSREPRVTAIRQPVALSRVPHFNACRSRVTTDYYLLLCHDDYLASRDALRSAREVMLGDPSVHAVYCDMMYVDARRRPIARHRGNRSGVFDARKVGRDCVMTGRNLFGIPLLMRTSAVRELPYEESLPYSADVDLAIASAAGGKAYHLPRPLIANRYHTSNDTWHELTWISNEMPRIAQRQGISLSPSERAQAVLGRWLTTAARLLFRAYIRVRR